LHDTCQQKSEELPEPFTLGTIFCHNTLKDFIIMW
jgi:hypothetical protein